METVQIIMERVPAWQVTVQIDVARIAGLEFTEYLFAHDIRELQEQYNASLEGLNG